MDEAPDPSQRTRTLLDDLDRLENAPCAACGRRICGHEGVMSIALGYKSSPRCAPCLARAMDRDLEGLKDQLYDYVQGRDCFREAWQRSTRREGADACPARRRATIQTPATKETMTAADQEWDAGDMACGDLVLQLRFRLFDMKAREVLRLTARDPGAPEDIPAWCGLTGHTLVSSAHPVYFIRRKEG